MSYFNDFLSLFYPNNCLACGNNLFKNEHLICISCQFHLPKTNFHLEKENPVSKMFWGRTRIETASAYYFFVKSSRIQHLIHQFKYKGKKEIGIFIGEQYGKELVKSVYFQDIDIIIPVPLHPKKEKIRGYNQSEIFARGLSSAMNLALDNKTLIRTYASETQTKKTRFKRWENVKEIFEIRSSEQIENKHILLVDDVITTGATLEACANLLNKIKGVRISIVSIAVTSH